MLVFSWVSKDDSRSVAVISGEAGTAERAQN
jgi:hypothetical protein